MTERHFTGGTKEFVYTKEIDEQIKREDESVRPFKEALKEFYSEKEKKPKRYEHIRRPNPYYHTPYYKQPIDNNPPYKQKSNIWKNILIVFSILLIIFIIFLFYPFEGKTEQIKANIIIKSNVSFFLDNIEQFHDQEVDLEGYLAYKPIYKNDMGFYTFLIVDDAENMIKLDKLTSLQKDLFEMNNRSEEPYEIKGILRRWKVIEVKDIKLAEKIKEIQVQDKEKINLKGLQDNVKEPLISLLTKIYNPKKCEDGTFNKFCSLNNPYYCNEGELEANPLKCGCPNDKFLKGQECVKIQYCSDGTIYDQCSGTMPLFCDNGKLINLASECGCDWEDVVEGETCVSKYETNPKTISLSYFGGTIQHTFYGGLNDYLSDLDRAMYYQYVPPTSRDFILKALDNNEQRKMLAPLIEKIKETNNNPEYAARNAISLVQNIPYDWDAFYSNDVKGKYPYEVLYTNSGVCSEKVQLIAYILREFGFEVAVLRFDLENHDALGIKCSSSYKYYKNTGYCFVEMTQPTPIGEVPNSYVGVGSLKSTPQVIKISDGNSFTKI